MTLGFLPLSRADMEERGIPQFDFVFVIGDAYVDHPSFGPAIISRVLESHGYSVGIISQPDIKDNRSISIYGSPRLGFLVSSGNMDSMVNHYYVSKKKREKDAYTPGGVTGKRPDFALKAYCKLIRRSYPKAPILIGGIEASLRRLAHYDYWSDELLPSVLLESGADLLFYGMGERSIVEAADALDSGIAVSDLSFIEGTVFKTEDKEIIWDAIYLPKYKELKQDKKNYAKSFRIQYKNTDPYSGRRLAEEYGDSIFVVQNPPSKPLSQEEMDQVYALPYMRTYHPSYEVLGGVPAIEEVKYSLISSRGCFGGCHFCALTFHQGRIVQSRSHESIIEEAKEMIQGPGFKGYIHDVGGPTANFRAPACDKQSVTGACINKQCMFPQLCENVEISHTNYLSLLRKLRGLPKVKKVFIRSGIRHDYLMADSDKSFLRELCEHHVSGQLKVAPEHVSARVLDHMGKPHAGTYRRFAKAYQDMNVKLNKKQYLVPYLMSSHPGSTLKEAIELAEFLRDLGYMPQQVQDFYPTPSTISTCMYYTGLDPLRSYVDLENEYTHSPENRMKESLSEVYVAKNPHEKAMQRALIQYRNPKNYFLVKEALTLAGRTDLIGYDNKCLIRPRGEDRKRFSPPSFDKKQGRKGKKKKTIRNVHKKKNR